MHMFYAVLAITWYKVFYLINIYSLFPFSIAKRQGSLSLPLNRELVEKGQWQMILITKFHLSSVLILGCYCDVYLSV